MEKIKTYLKSILVPVAVGGIIGAITSNAIDYNTLIQPSFAPPSILFPIVWTILYALMGISYGILKVNSLNDENIKFIYYLQLIVNALWSIIFFVLKQRFLAFIWILLLDVLVVTMIYKFYKKDKLAGLLQILYLLWIIFATVLNFSVYWLNR